MLNNKSVSDQITDAEATLKDINSEINRLEEKKSFTKEAITSAKKRLDEIDKNSQEYKILKEHYDTLVASEWKTDYDLKVLNEKYMNQCVIIANLYDLEKELEKIEDFDTVEETPPLLEEKEVVKTISESSKQLDKLFEIDLYVYIAGVYIPVLGVTIESAFSAMPAATVEVPPDPVFLGIGREDRVPVQIFIKDTFSNLRDNKDIPGLLSSLGNNLVAYDKYITSNKIQNNKLLIFSGEIVSYSYSSTPSGRYISLNCQSDLTFINDIKIEHGAELSPLLRAFGSGNSNDTLQNVTNTELFPMSLFYFGLNVTANNNGAPVERVTAPTPPNSPVPTPAVSTPNPDNEVIKVPGDFMDNLMTFLQVGDMNKKSSLVTYYLKHSNELQLNNRYVKIPFFDNTGTFGGEDTGFPILQALKNIKVMDFISRVADLSPTNTVFEYINYIAANMEYDFSVQNSPKLVTGGGAPRLAQILFKPMLYEALPPTCNIIQKEHILQVNFSEQVRGVPTRVIGQNTSGTAQLIGANNSEVTKALMDMIYPSQLASSIADNLSATDPAPQNYYTPDLMDNDIVNEKYTGPYVHRFALPGWLDFIGTSDKKSYTASEDKVNWARHHWIMARAEYRTVAVSMTFNPFLVVGAPAVVLDADVFEGFSLIGYVISISHSINKGSATTQVVLNFPRMLSDERNKEKRLENTVPMISDKVTHNKNNMDILYNYIYGCRAYNYLEDNSFRNNGNNPRKAYINNYRKICTLEQFYDFLATDMNTSKYTNWRSSAGKTELHREIIYKDIKLESLRDRRDKNLVDNLLKLQDRLLHSDIYT